MSLGDERGDLGLRMKRGKPDHVGAGIAASAEHGGSYWLVRGHDESLEEASRGTGLAESDALRK
jgi:hypothetical protein